MVLLVGLELPELQLARAKVAIEAQVHKTNVFKGLLLNWWLYNVNQQFNFESKVVE